MGRKKERKQANTNLLFENVLRWARLELVARLHTTTHDTLRTSAKPIEDRQHREERAQGQRITSAHAASSHKTRQSWKERGDIARSTHHSHSVNENPERSKSDSEPDLNHGVAADAVHVRREHELVRAQPACTTQQPRNGTTISQTHGQRATTERRMLQLTLTSKLGSEHSRQQQRSSDAAADATGQPARRVKHTQTALTKPHETSDKRVPAHRALAHLLELRLDGDQRVRRRNLR